MNKNVLVGLLVITAGSLSSCAWLRNQHVKHDDSDTLKFAHRTGSRTIAVGRFERVHVRGHISLKLIAGTEQSDVRILGDQAFVNNVRAEVRDGTLYIYKQKKVHAGTMASALAIVRTDHISGIDQNGTGSLDVIGLDDTDIEIHSTSPSHVNVKGKDVKLHKLALDGHAKVNIEGVRSDRLDITSKGKNIVSMRGVANIHHVKFSGEGRLDMHWVYSKYLRIEGEGKAYVRLGGRVDTLDVNLEGNSYFNGRYLRAKNAYIKTYEAARADVQVAHNQNAKAQGFSNIYFYKGSDFQYAAMDKNAAVLSMGKFILPGG